MGRLCMGRKLAHGLTRTNTDTLCAGYGCWGYGGMGRLGNREEKGGYSMNFLEDENEKARD